MKTKQSFTENKRLLKSALGLIAAGCFGTAAADAVESPYTVAVISDAAHGRQVLQGKYEDAIRNIKPSQRGAYARYYAANNLCVAYVMTRNIDAAATACNDAITAIRGIVDRQPGTAKRSDIARTQRKFLAMALSNRGVLNAISGDEERARKDFTQALALEAGLPAPASNMARLSSADLPPA